MLSKVGLYYRTIKHLKPIQIRYRLWYMLRSKLRKLTSHSYPLSTPKESHILNLKTGIPKPATFDFRPSTFEYCFNFLNRSHLFEKIINWNFSKYGKLWAYNLNYFDYVQQDEMTKEQGLALIREFIKQIEINSEGLEPYPISLRSINWIKFLSKHKIEDKKIDSSLYAQYQILLDNIEYHILGNHLLENGCSLLFGAFYFNDDKLWRKAREIIRSELEEQILNDGGHYERSAMYHCIILERLLDCYNLLINNTRFSNQKSLEKELSEYLGKMLGWLRIIQWNDGTLPEVNDCVSEMLPKLPAMYDYVDRLEVRPKNLKLEDSGYRKYSASNYEFLADAGNIGPDYVPGHAHSDIFSFILRINRQEIITDTGTSTYKDNKRRNVERSTSAHNTVVVHNKEQNEMWSAFRVGRRGHVNIIEDEYEKIRASHDGYKFIGIKHERRFEFGENSITISDYLKGANKNKSGTFYLHFYPDVQLIQSDNEIQGDSFRISFNGHGTIKVDTYKKALGYGKLKKAERAVVSFNQELITEIDILAT